MDARSASESEIVLSQLMLPEHANPFGNVHGAWVMKLVDEAAGAAAMRHCRSRVVTKLIDQMTFDGPVHVNDLIHAAARLTWTGRTSLEVAVVVDAEKMPSGQRRRTNTAFLIFVALDAEGNPYPVPPLRLDTPEDRLAWVAAEERRAQRLARS